VALSLLALACAGDDGTGPDDGIASVAITGETTVPARATVLLEAEARSSSGGVIEAGSVSWSSSDEAVATVSSTGEVRGLVPGSTTITATIDGISGTAEVTVEVADLTALADSLDAAHGVPAIGGAIVSADGLIAFGVAGDRRIGGPPVTADDQWHIGSNLKAVTAYMAAVAVDAGMLEWGTTVEEVFSELDVRDGYRPVTLRDLVTNQSGLPRNPSGLRLQGSDPRTQRNQVAAWAFRQPPVVARGTYSYSNIGFAMAGAMIERAYGAPFESVIQSELFDPLGVTRAGWGPQTAPGATDNPVPHRWSGGGWVACEGCDNPPWLSAAGRMHVPLDQWALLIQEMLRAENGDSELVDAATGDLLTTGEVSIAGSEQYGYGWIVTSRSWAGGTTLVHTGSNTINHSVAWVAPGRDFALLAVTNAADLQGGRTGRALDAMVGRMLGYYQTGE
jgi:CubicO group peptidase (beta-lactamase class C family)